MKILVVCGAGASSTFVAQRLRQAAQNAGFDWQTAAGTEHSPLSEHDLVLIGPHLSDRVDAIRGTAHGTVALLPHDVFADRSGERTLAHVLSLLADADSALKGTS